MASNVLTAMRLNQWLFPGNPCFRPCWSPHHHQTMVSNLFLMGLLLCDSSYKLSVIIKDATGRVKIFLFGGVAKQVVRRIAAELVEESSSNQILLPAPLPALLVEGMSSRWLSVNKPLGLGSSASKLGGCSPIQPLLSLVVLPDVRRMILGILKL
jgi:hypothetical protein